MTRMEHGTRRFRSLIINLNEQRTGPALRGQRASR